MEPSLLRDPGMVDLESSLRDVLLREEPEVPPAHTTVDALAALERTGDLPVDVLRRYAFADPAVALALLEAANAPGAPSVAALTEAEERLGEAEFVRIVRTVRDDRPAVAAGPLATARHRAWRGAVVSAMLCRELARDRGVSPDEAYVCGLLHDIGRIAAFAAFERLVGGMRPRGPVSLRRWEMLAERWHIALGLAIAERHELPPSLVEVIAFHHPDRARVDGEEVSPLLRIVRSVDGLVAVLLQGADSAAAVEDADLTSAEAVRLSEAVTRMLDHVSSLERQPRSRGTAPAAAPQPALHEPRGDGVRLRLAGREYCAVGFAPHQLLVSGPAPLGEGALLEVQILDRRRAPFHARVLTAWQDGARFGAILLPLALSGPSLAELGGTLPKGADA
jgi:putative nucleotidyltransferase with HDIG domain